MIAGRRARVARPFRSPCMTPAFDLDAPCASIARAIDTAGHGVVPHFIDGALTAALRRRALALDAADALHAAGVGRGRSWMRDPAVRGDRIHWLDESEASAAEHALLDALEGLRRALNERLMLGLFEVEAHYALYPAGAHYAPHRDRFRDDDARVVSCVLYLNDGWQPHEGGMLRLHVEPVALDVLPRGGTLVAFRADRTLHEVLPATRTRLSIAAWFRRRS